MMADEAVAPKTPGMAKQEMVLEETQEHSGSLPELSKFPKEWHVFILHLVYAQVRIKTTLPQAWEQIFGKTERYIAVAPMKLIEFDEERKSEFLCDVFPPKSAELFRKWLNAQVFLDRSKKLYFELFTEEFYPVEGKSLLPNIVHVAGLSTCGGVVVTDKPLTLPVSFKLMLPDAGVAQRAKFAMEQPEKLVSGLEDAEQAKRRALMEKANEQPS